MVQASEGPGLSIYSLSRWHVTRFVFWLAGNSIIYLIIFNFVYLFLEGGRGRGRETSMCERYMVASHTPPTGDLAHNPACTLTGNRTSDSLVCRLVLNPLSHSSQGQLCILNR